MKCKLLVRVKIIKNDKLENNLQVLNIIRKLFEFFKRLARPCLS